MNINFNLNFDRLVRFNEAFWKKLGSNVIAWIREDAKVGFFQTDEPVKDDYSPEYAKLKERRFNSVTNRRYAVENDGLSINGGLATTKSGKNVYRIKNGRKGQRIGAYKGVSITSNETEFVNMTVSGQTLRGLHIAEATNKSVTLSYQPRDAMKIIGNQRPGLNRRLVGLRAKNRKKLTDIFMADVTSKIMKDIVGRTTINIKI